MRVLIEGLDRGASDLSDSFSYLSNFHGLYSHSPQDIIIYVVFVGGMTPIMSKGKLIQNGVHLREHEYQTVLILLNEGYDIELIPPSQIKNLPMPDIMMQGVPWEIKSPSGNGKNTLKHIIQKAKHQAESIIVDLRRCKIDDEQAVAEIIKHYQLSRRIRRIKIVKKSGDIIDFSK